MKKLLSFCIALSVISGLFAADLEEMLEDLSGTAAREYVKPIVTAFGANLNSGWFHRAPKAKLLGVNVEFGVIVMASMFSEDDESFDTSGSFFLNRNQAEMLTEGIDPLIREYVIDAMLQQEFDVGMYGPTITGPDDEFLHIVFPEEEISFVGPGGTTQTVIVPGEEFEVTQVHGLMEDFPALPLFAPQLTIGTLYGTQVSFRFVPTYDIPDIGDFNYFGFGLQHNPKAWLPVPLPVDVSASFFTQTMEVGSYMKATGTTMGINVSKTFGPRMFSFTPYAGLMFESSNMEFKYDYTISNDLVDPEVRTIKFDLDGENSNRLTLGGNLRLGVFNLNADYSIAKYPTLSTGFGVAW